LASQNNHTLKLPKTKAKDELRVENLRREKQSITEEDHAARRRTLKKPLAERLAKKRGKGSSAREEIAG